MSPLTDADLAALDFAAEHADIIGYSFVQRPSDIQLLQEELDLARQVQMYSNTTNSSAAGTLYDEFVTEAAGLPDERSNTDLYMRLVLEDIPHRRESVFRHTQNCV